MCRLFPLIGYVTVQSFAATLLGLALGKRMGSKAAETAAVLAGLIFVVLGALIVYQTANSSDPEHWANAGDRRDGS
jgi:putative Mn2+ efflux pump MntP